MNNSFEMRTKVFYAPTKSGQIWKMLLNVGYWICVVAAGLVLLVALIVGDWEVALSALYPIAILTIFMKIFNAKAKNVAHYENAIVNGTVTEQQIILKYRQMNLNKKTWEYVNYWIDTQSITELEFSDQLCCFRICADIVKQIEGSSEREQFDEHYLYVEEGRKEEIIRYIQDATSIPIRFMDRE